MLAAEWLISDRAMTPAGFGTRCRTRGYAPASRAGKSRDKAVLYHKRRYKRRNRIEIMFGRLKDWRRIATRCDRCPKVFLSAIALAATVIFWL
ncbi:transposase [Meridianimarinicoccus roseus]|uniref:transposase n=1 Tax=Meridianimarinicoccus roseus TaxID=2072018 RepID=UPI003B75B454